MKKFPGTGGIMVMIVFSWMFIDVLASDGHAADEGLQWERFRLLPEITVCESYSNNVYRSASDLHSDSTTIIAPAARIDFALTPQDFISARYRGSYSRHERLENFRTYVDQTGLGWTLMTPLTTTVKTEVSLDRDSIQPYSSADRSKDFKKKNAHVDIALKSLSYTDIMLRYDHTSRRFDDLSFAQDDFDSDMATVGALYRVLSATKVLAEYAYYHQKNRSRANPDLATHTGLIGAEWEATSKLTGYVKLGAYRSRLNDASSVSGFALDSNLSYSATEDVRFSLIGYRRLVRSTFTDRETGEYYISAGGTASASYARWTHVTISADASYTRNEFSRTAQNRIDEAWAAGAAVRYAPRDWMSFSVGYHYRNNDSSVSVYGYRERSVEAKVLLAL